LRTHCRDLRGYVQNNRNAVINHGRRHRSGKPISTSRAEGCVEEIANARMAKCRRMHCFPRGAHHVAMVRSAMLDGRLHKQIILPRKAA